MDIDEIRTFLAIAETGGFTRAGQRLHRSQPAISRRIELLEHGLGAPLFDRMRGRARLTEAGRAFLPHAEAALAALKDGQDAVRALQAGPQGAVSLALVGTLADTQIVDTLRRFARRAPEVRLELRTASSAEVTDLVRRGEATLGLRYFRSDRPDLVELAAGSESMLVVAARDHRLAGRRRLRARDLATRALDRFSAVARRSRFIGPSAGAPARPRRSGSRRPDADRQPDGAEAPRPGRASASPWCREAACATSCGKACWWRSTSRRCGPISQSPPCTAVTATSVPQPRLCSSC